MTPVVDAMRFFAAALQYTAFRRGEKAPAEKGCWQVAGGWRLSAIGSVATPAESSTKLRHRCH